MASRTAKTYTVQIIDTNANIAQPLTTPVVCS